MPSLPRILGLSSASTVTDTEEGRAFFQRRLSVFGLCIFVLAGGSWVVLSVATVVAGFTQHAVLSAGSLLHFSNGAVGGVLWLVTRRGKLAGGLLHGLDVLCSLALIAIWGMSGAFMPDRVVGGFIALLSFIMGMLARAIIVPSTARRTLIVGSLGAAIIVGFSVARGGGDAVVGSAIAIACWSASAVTISTFASHTIFGLRREIQAARVLGQYTLETKLGEGGMGAVWRAHHALLRRPTVVKLLPPERMGEAAIQRFEREVQLTARLTHPNTVAIYDYGRTRDGIFYYAMEYLEGIDLERLVAQHGPQPPERVAHLLIQVCGALAEAHDLGLVHRDVKPANILLSPRKNEHEFAKILDFGLVKNVDTRPDDANVTATNVIAGTPFYMAPEAIQAPDSVDARSDLYALGAVAWFLLVGRPVFEGKTLVSVCGKHLHEAPLPPSEAADRPLPAALEVAVLACLSKRPEQRPLDARTLRAQIEAAGIADKWTAERAGQWWERRERGERLVREPSGPRTIALHLDDRVLG